MKKILSLTLSVIMAVVFTAGMSCCSAAVNEKAGEAEAMTQTDNVFPYHEPYGKGIGAMPGRVVWSHEPDSVDWNGSGYWWQTSNFNEAVIKDMVNDSIASLGGKATAKEGWDSLFTAHNSARNKSTGYTKGEKIAVKANINGSAVFDDDTSGETAMSYTNPVLLKALLISLVEEAGVEPSDITVYDVSRLFPDYMVKMCTEGNLSGVNFVGRNTGVADENVPINWSYKFSGAVNYIPTCVTQAEYVINLANLKGHSYGITLCGKNHFGSFINGNAMRPPEGANLHQFLTRNEMGIYSPLTDLMANYELGKKTVLYMLDALICAVSEGSSITAENSRWQQAPFNNDFTSSIFVSQDPVAIDSVGADFLINEPAVVNNNSVLRNNPNVENYLHEAGLVENAPSGTVYYDGNGKKVTNLGVHEHWNNSTDKLYSRNLGKSEGIELVKTGEKPKEKSKTLIAVFSRTGNTRKIADFIHDNVGGDMFDIKTVREYSDDYDTILQQAAEEKNTNARPELSAHVDNMEDYDTVFVGYPIWWGDTPMAIMTFLESYDFSGKKVIPFCTSGSSSPQTSFNRIKNTIPNANVLTGFWTQGDNAAGSDAAVKEWLEGLDLSIPEKIETTTETTTLSAAETTTEAVLPSDSTDARAELTGTDGINFVAGVDSLDYRQVGFIFEAEGKTVRKSTDTVYTSLKGSDIDINALNSKYIYGFTVYDIPRHDTNIKVIPFRIDTNGNEITLQPIICSINSLEETQTANTAA